MEDLVQLDAVLSVLKSPRLESNLSCPTSGMVGIAHGSPALNSIAAIKVADELFYAWMTQLLANMVNQSLGVDASAAPTRLALDKSFEYVVELVLVKGSGKSATWRPLSELAAVLGQDAAAAEMPVSLIANLAEETKTHDSVIRHWCADMTRFLDGVCANPKICALLRADER